MALVLDWVIIGWLCFVGLICQNNVIFMWEHKMELKKKEVKFFLYAPEGI